MFISRKDVNRHRNSADKSDIINLYYLFFARVPETDEAVRQKMRLSKNRIIIDLLGSQEFFNFNEQELTRIIRSELPVDIEYRIWTAKYLPLTSDTVFEIVSSTTWGELYTKIFADPVFKSLVVGKVRKFNGRFLEILHSINQSKAAEPNQSAQSGQQLQPTGSFDGLSAGIATGWIWNSQSPEEPAKVEFRIGPVVVGSGEASLFRHDVMAAGFGNGLAGFRIPLTLPRDSNDVEVRAYAAGTNYELSNSPRLSSTPGPIKLLFDRSKKLDTVRRIKISHRIAKLGVRPKISLIMPMYNTKPEWLVQALESVRNQLSDNWELICIDDASSDKNVSLIAQAYAKADSRIKAIRLNTNRGIAAATNTGIANATGDYIAFLDHDDFLEPNAVLELAQAARDGADLIYSDELITDADIENPILLCARPAFCYDYYLSHPYFVHLVCVRRDLALSIGGWDETMSISADVDFILRTIEKSRTVLHIPKTLYRWRTHGASAGHSKQNDVTQATIGALNRHLGRIRTNAEAVPGPCFNVHRIQYEDQPKKVLIFIPTKNRVDVLRPCIESIFATVNPNEVDICIIDHMSDDEDTKRYIASLTGRARVFQWDGPFNYGAMHNAAFQATAEAPELILFMNNDIETISAGWFEEMRSQALRPDIGIVGSKLLYHNDTIQHNGVIIGMGGSADHAFKFHPHMTATGDINEGYLESLVSTRQYSAVTAACMMMRTELFRKVGGFDERLAIGFNDTDLCLKVGALGYRNINTPYAVLHHYESATRIKDKQMDHPEDSALFIKKWDHILKNGDPFYNPQLSISGSDHVLVGGLPRKSMNRLQKGLGTESIDRSMSKTLFSPLKRFFLKSPALGQTARGKEPEHS